MTYPSQRKYPFPTLIYFTVASLHAEAARLQALGLPHVQYSSKKDPGLKADIYGYSGKITLGSRYCLNKRPKKSRLGELGLISLEQARQKHRSRCTSYRWNNLEHVSVSLRSWLLATRWISIYWRLGECLRQITACRWALFRTGKFVARFIGYSWLNLQIICVACALIQPLA